MAQKTGFVLIDDVAALQDQEELMRLVFPVHRQLRPQFADFDAYYAQVGRAVADRAQLLVLQGQAGQVLGLALFRMHHNTYQHKLFFLEDLVVDEALRGQDLGACLLQRCEQLAREAGCHYLSLDSATHRTRAHKFYFVQGYVADCFHFSRKL